MTEGLETKRKQKNQTEGEKRLIQFFEYYNNCVNGKITDFEKVKSYLTETLELLLEQGKIGDGVLLLSRIKSPASVTEKMLMGGRVHDIFGITLLTQTQEEMDKIRSAIRKGKKFDISSRKQKNEKRGYEAIHFVFNVGDENTKKTMVECHMQTHENYKNVYPHCFYKVRKKANRDLTSEEEKQIAEEIQRRYESGEILGHQLSNGKKSGVPQMWLASFNQQGKMEEQELEEEQILKILYPFLDLSKKKTKESSILNEDEVEI